MQLHNINHEAYVSKTEKTKRITKKSTTVAPAARRSNLVLVKKEKLSLKLLLKEAGGKERSTGVACDKYPLTFQNFLHWLIFSGSW